MKKNQRSTHRHGHNNEQLLDVKGVIAFFQYVGLISTLIVINLGIMAFFLMKNSETVRLEIRKPVLGVHTSKTIAQNSYINNKAKNLSSMPLAEASKVKPSKALNTLIAYSTKPQSNKVLGASTKADVLRGTFANQCSFKQGTKLYANGSTVSIKKADLANQFCISASANTDNYLWNIQGNNSKGNCIDLSTYNLSSKATAIEAFASGNGQAANCSLLVERIN